MPQRPHKPEGWPTLSPYLTVRDARKSMEFYEKAFGFETSGQPMEMDGKVTHVGMKYKEAAIMFSPEGGFGCEAQAPTTSGARPSINLYVYVEDVDKLYERAVNAGAKSLSEPEDMFWGDRMCSLGDLDGYIWSFATNVGEFDPTKIPTAEAAAAK